MRDSRRSDHVAWAILALVPALFFADILLGFNALFIRDVSRYYYPAKKILREIVLSGSFPYWNPWFSAGQPLAANPEHEVFYPPTWLILLPDYLTGFHLLVVGHVFLAVFAMWALLRSLGTPRAAAVAGALAFGTGGLIASTLNLFPYLFSGAWIPLTCLYTRRFLLTASRRDFALASALLGVQLLVGEPVTALQTGLLLGLYAIGRGWRDGGLPAVMRNVLTVGAISLAALLVSAVQTVPTIDHLRDSVRARGISYEWVSTWSTPPVRFLELLFPVLHGDAAAGAMELPGRYWGQSLYPGTRLPFFFSIYSGLAVTIAAAAGVVARRRGWGLFLAAASVSALAAVGGQTPILAFLHGHGLATFARYPEKFLIMGVFALVVFGSCALGDLLEGNARVRRVAIGVAAAVAAIGALLALVSLTGAYAEAFWQVWEVHPARRMAAMIESSRAGWVAVFARALLLVFMIRLLPRMREPAAIGLVALYTLLDLATVVPAVAPRVPREYYTDPPAAERRFPASRDDFRLFHYADWLGAASLPLHGADPERYWVVRNGLYPMMPAAWNLRTVLEIDYDQTNLQTSEDFTQSIAELAPLRRDWMKVAAAMSNARYVALPVPRDAAIARAGENARAIQPVALADLGTAHPRYYFASDVVAVRSREEFVRQMAVRPDAAKAAFVQSVQSFAPAAGRVVNVRETPNSVHLEVEADGRSFLVAGITPHRYWTATIDGAEVPAVVTNAGYQGVEVAAGRHLVELTYRNPLIPAAGIVSLLTVAALLAGGRRPRAPLESAPCD